MVPSKSALGVKDLNGKKVAIAAERPDRTILDSPHVFAGVLLLVAMAVAFNGLLKWIELGRGLAG